MATLGAFFRYPGDGAAVWAGTSIAITISPHGTDTWQYDTEVGSPQASAHQVAQSILTWGNDAARPWFGSETLSVTYNDESPRLGVTLTATATATFNASGDLQLLMLWPGLTVATSISSSDGVPGSVRARFGVSGYKRSDLGPGGVAAGGSWRIGTSPTSLRRPQMTATLKAAQQFALANAMRLSKAPRVADVYQIHTDTWLTLSIGRVDARQGILLREVEFQVLGDPA